MNTLYYQTNKRFKPEEYVVNEIKEPFLTNAINSRGWSYTSIGSFLAYSQFNKRYIIESPTIPIYISYNLCWVLNVSPSCLINGVDDPNFRVDRYIMKYDKCIMVSKWLDIKQRRKLAEQIHVASNFLDYILDYPVPISQSLATRIYNGINSLFKKERHFKEIEVYYNIAFPSEGFMHPARIY